MNEVDGRDAFAELGLPRRSLLAGLGGFSLFALLSEAAARPVSRRIGAGRWIARQEEIAQALSTGSLRPRDWMSEVERLAAEVDLAELMATVNAARIIPAGPAAHNDPAKRFVKFLDDDGRPRKLSYGVALFDFAPGNVVTPHGHRNMVSAHMVVAGKVRVRNFDRIGDAPDAMLIRPTRDYVARLGQVSTMSSDADNIHWFVPVDGPATTFDVIISGIDPALPEYEIRAIDPVGGQRRGDGAILAPIMDFEAASARYTAAI